MANSWASVSNIPSGLSPDTMILLTDGSVLVHNAGGMQWYRLTPDSKGRYNSGVWTGPFNMANTRQFFASGVLMDGRVFAIGGEYSDAGNATPKGEIFDPVTNAWSALNKPTPSFDFINSDAVSTVLTDGRVLFGSPNGPRTAIWDPVIDLWTEAGLGFGASAQTKQSNTNEESWALLPDGSVLTVEIAGVPAAEKYIPTTDRWVSAGNTPANLPIRSLADMNPPGGTVNVSEIGPTVVLPDGRCFCIGATGRTALYTPPANPVQAGTWAAGPNFPADTSGNNFNNANGNFQTIIDGPCSLLTNGRVLCVAGNTVRETGTDSNGNPTVQFWSNPCNIYVADPIAGTITALAPQPSSAAVDVWRARLLLLPTGQVLFTTQSSGHLEILTLDAATATPNAAWKPTITAAPPTLATGHSYVLTGTQFNGLSQACNYGDDAGVSTNYPIVRLTNTSTNDVVYLRSFAFSSLGIATGTTPQNATIEVPATIPKGQYRLQVIANGIASDSVTVDVVQQDCFFLIERSTYGQGEIQALINLNGTPAIIDPALYVVVEGFTPSQLGLTGANLASPPNKPAIPSPTSGVRFEFTGAVIPEDTSLPNRAQRFTFPFKAVFDDATPFNFTPSVKDLTLVTSLTAASTTVTNTAIVKLIKNPNPYILHGGSDPNQPWYLSVDVRVFQIKAGATKFAAQIGTGTNARTVATTYIQQVITNLNGSPGSANGIFDALPLDEPTASLALAPTDSGGTRVYNFAVARVRYRDTIPATDVRAFFRMWPAQQTNATYNTNTLYRAATNASGQRIPLLGVQGDEIMTIPFFASPRVNAGAVNMNTQIDAPNVQPINPDSLGGEVSRFFGCWLDINQPTDLLFPARLIGPTPANIPDGPFTGMGPLLPIQQLVRSAHQCLITEIAFDPDPIPSYADPSTSDKLAQRNLTFVNVPNPGLVDSRRVPQTFEMRPTPQVFPDTLPPDELMIEWDDIPADSEAQVYLPGTTADEILDLARQVYGTHRLTRFDDHTISFPAGGVTYVPIPRGTDVNFAGLLTVDLPAGIKKGNTHHVTVRQVTSAASQIRISRGDQVGVLAAKKTGRKAAAAKAGAAVTVAVDTSKNDHAFDLLWRRVLGVFHITIPVSTKAELLEPEERLLSVLRWIELSIPLDSRWYLVFKRYVEQIARRVGDMGGDPDKVGADPNGDWKHEGTGKTDDHDHDHDHDGSTSGDDDDAGHAKGRRRYTGKIAGLIHNRYGEFIGFTLDTQDGLRTFEGSEKATEVLTRWAWQDRITITVEVDDADPDRPLRITLDAATAARRD